MGAPKAGSVRPVCMIVHAYYEEDPRVRREAESLVAAGRPVDVFALRRPADAESGELAGVRIRRLNVQRHQGAGIKTYLLEYGSFLVRSAVAVTRAHRHRHYALVHVHSLPDYLAFAALPLRILRVPLLLDLHEAMPDFFRMRFPRLANPFFHWLLRVQERLSIGLASHVVTVNEPLAARLVTMGVAPGKITVLMNSPSLARFDAAAHQQRSFMADGVLRLVYAGALTPTYELDVVLESIGRLRSLRPDLPVRLTLYGRGDSEPGLRALSSRLGLDDIVELPGRIPIEDVPAAIAAADIGLAPTRRDPFTDASLSTKIFEYGAMRKPVVASRLPLVESVFADGSAYLYSSGDSTDLAAPILEIVDDPVRRDASVAKCLERVRELAWERSVGTLVGLVDRLTSRPVSSTP